MAGISDLPFRRICQRLGCHYSIAEMVNARPELLDSAQSQTRLQFDDDPAYPKIVQLAGGDPALMAEAALLMQTRGADIIDINLGCPAKKVGRQNAGAALLAEPRTVEKILDAVCAATRLPVTLKTRIGLDERRINLPLIGDIAEACGIAAITVHGRTRAQRFAGNARYEEIAALKNRLRLPVIVNGDIATPEQAHTLITRYHFDGVMIGRAAQGNPWIFSAVRAVLDPEWTAPPVGEKNSLIREHIRALHRLYPAPVGTLCARKHLHWYYRDHPHYPVLREHINHSRNAAAQLAALPAS